MSRSDIEGLYTDAAPARPLWLRPRRQRRHARAVIASLGLVALVAVCTLMMLALPLIATP